MNVTTGTSPQGDASSSSTGAVGSSHQQPALPAVCSRSIPSWIHWTRQHGESNTKKSLFKRGYPFIMMYLHAEFQDAGEQVVSSPAACS